MTDPSAGRFSKIITRFRRPIVQTTAANLTAVGLGTLSGVFTARGLGPEGRGEWAVIMAFFTVAIVVGEVGQSGAVTFIVARNPTSEAAAVRRARRIMMCAGALLATAGILLAPIMAGGNSEVTQAYRLASVGICINSIFAARLYAMHAKSGARWNAARVAQPFFYVSGIAIMLLLGVMTVVGVALSLIVSTSLQFVVLAGLDLQLRRSERRAPEVSTDSHGCATDDTHTVKAAAEKQEFKLSQGLYGARYAAAAVPTVVAAQYDKLALSRLVDSAEVGVFAVGSTVALLVAPFSAAIANVVFPQASRRHFASEQRQSFERRTLILTFVVSSVVSVALSAAAPVVVPLLFGSAFSAAVYVVWALAGVMVGRALSQVTGALLRARGLPGSTAVAQIGGLLLGALLIIPAVQALGLLGAAVALGAGEALTLSLLLAAIARRQRRDRDAGAEA